MVHACRMLAIQLKEPADELFYAWIAQVLQYRGTSQGAMFDTDTLNPLLENPAVHEALKLWKQVAGLPELTGTLRVPEIGQLWFTGRCAMIIGTSAFYTALQNGPFVANTGTAIMPGSEHVWVERGEGGDHVQCLLLQTCHRVRGWSGGQPCSTLADHFWTERSTVMLGGHSSWPRIHS